MDEETELIAVGKGAILNVASEAALRGSAAGVAYTASKYAVVGITKSTAVMYAGRGIRTNAVVPGAVPTSIEAPVRSEHAAGVVGPLLQSTMPAPAGADLIAAAITWLLSEEADNVNGVVLASDGGWSAL